MQIAGKSTCNGQGVSQLPREAARWMAWFEPSFAEQFVRSCFAPAGRTSHFAHSCPCFMAGCWAVQCGSNVKQISFDRFAVQTVMFQAPSVKSCAASRPAMSKTLRSAQVQWGLDDVDNRRLSDAPKARLSSIRRVSQLPARWIRFRLHKYRWFAMLWRQSLHLLCVPLSWVFMGYLWEFLTEQFPVVSLRAQGIFALGASLRKVNASLPQKMRTTSEAKRDLDRPKHELRTRYTRCIVKASLLGLLCVSTSKWSTRTRGAAGQTKPIQKNLRIFVYIVAEFQKCWPTG